MPKAPPITRETAREYSARGNKVRWDNWRLAKEQAKLHKPAFSATPDDSQPIARTKMQLAQLDDLIDAALARKDQRSFLALAGAKERLWKLVQPTAGVMKPASRRAANRPAAEPISDQTPQAAG